MLKRIAITIMLIGLVGMAGGCASTIATMDTANALRVAGDQNVTNWLMATAAQANVHDDILQELEDRFQARLLASQGGAEAVKELIAYRAQQEVLRKAKFVDLEEYAKAVDNSILIRELNEKMIGIWKRWDALLGRVPAVYQLRILAEAETRKYMENLK